MQIIFIKFFFVYFMYELKKGENQKSIVSLQHSDISETSFLDKSGNPEQTETQIFQNKKANGTFETESKKIRKNKPVKIVTTIDPKTLEESHSIKSVSPSLKKMFGLIGNLGRGIKKNLTVLGGIGINSVAANLLKIQEKLKFLKSG